MSPCNTKELVKSSKRKQKLYEKFFKERSYENEKQYKTYKNVFEKIKKNSKKLYYQDKLSKFQTDVKRTWTTNLDYYERNSWEDQSTRKQFSKKSNDRRYKNYRKIINSKKS